MNWLYKLGLIIILIFSFIGESISNDIRSNESSVTLIRDTSSTTLISSDYSEANGPFDQEDNLSDQNLQSDSSKRGLTVTRVEQQFDVKTSISLERDTENVTHRELYIILGNIDSLINTKNEAFYNDSIMPILKDYIESCQINDELKAKAYSTWKYLAVLLFILTALFHYLHWKRKGVDHQSYFKAWFSIFAILLVASIIMIGVSYRDLIM